ncbi:hypothetical protein IKG28_01390 [Candidatus Saccharibacteria bacterium]|nr:hypothetical protein [Candidatus Saccharibacteria bacterium]
MDQNQPVDNDLQKAIDDITQTTNIDPVFSDPVAAPSSVPEGDTGELGEPVGPFPEPKVEIEPTPTAPEMAPLTELQVPDLMASIPAPEPAAPAPEPAAPAPEPIVPPLDTAPAAPVAENLNMHQVKEAALRDLVPLLDRVNMDATQRFNIYRDIFENLKDYTVLEPAYKAAKEIPDETKRAEALLYLVESIDKM